MDIALALEHSADARPRRTRGRCDNVPGLRLTARQASRFWSLDPASSGELLDSVVEAGLLCKTGEDSYVLPLDSSIA